MALLGWSPDSGAIDQTSDDKLRRPARWRAGPRWRCRTADYQSRQGRHRAREDGGLIHGAVGPRYPFAPSLQAVSTTELTISGPDDLFVNTTRESPRGRCHRRPGLRRSGPTAAGRASHLGRPASFARRSSPRSGYAGNSLGLTLDPVPGGYRVHGDVTSATLGVRTNTPYPVTIMLNLSGGYDGASTATTFGGHIEVTFAPTGPVLNDIPAGYTVSAPSVANNRC